MVHVELYDGLRFAIMLPRDTLSREQMGVKWRTVIKIIRENFFPIAQISITELISVRKTRVASSRVSA